MIAMYLVSASIPSPLLAQRSVFGAIQISRTNSEALVYVGPQVRELRVHGPTGYSLEARMDQHILILICCMRIKSSIQPSFSVLHTSDGEKTPWLFGFLDRRILITLETTFTFHDSIKEGGMH